MPLVVTTLAAVRFAKCSDKNMWSICQVLLEEEWVKVEAPSIDCAVPRYGRIPKTMS